MNSRPLTGKPGLFHNPFCNWFFVFSSAERKPKSQNCSMSIKAYSQKNQYAFALLICSNMSNVLKGRVTYKSKPWYSLVYMYFYMVIWWCCNAQSASSPVWRCWREEEHYVVHKPHPPPVWFWSFEKRGCCHCSEIEPSHRGKKKEYIVVGPCVCVVRSSLCYLHLFFSFWALWALCIKKARKSDLCC